MAWRYLLYPFLALLTLVIIGIGVFAMALGLLYPSLPSLDILTDYRPKIPLRVYTHDGALIGEFGEERRAVVKLSEVPVLMRQAILAAEDDRFYQHHGVDYQGVARAALANLMAMGTREGASTITMQVARTFFLTNERTMKRKLLEILMAMKIEHALSKDQILELYINQIYLGQRSYGFAAAASAYYSKQLAELTPSEMAMLAGLPKAPAKYNPVVNPKRAALRQQYVLRRMHELHYLDDAAWQESTTHLGRINPEHLTFAVPADYVAEMARQYMFETYGESAYSGGYRVVTTIERNQQEAAYAALRRGVLEYDRRHGYRGPEGFTREDLRGEDAYEDMLAEKEPSGNLIPALVLEASPKTVRVYIKGGDSATIDGDGLRFAQRMLAENAPEATRIRTGSIVRVLRDSQGHWQITQMPQVESALVAVDP